MRPSILAAGLFIVLGAAFIPLAGVQADEALFATPIFAHPDADWLHRDIPVMLMSYLGTLKTFLYLPVFAMFGTSVWATRLPMLCAGAATILFFYRLAQRSRGAFAASLGVFLLATDPLFLLTHTFDWGPVALQILLTTAGLYSLARFADHGSARWLALGFLSFGVALWNKALFSWILAGLALAAPVFWTEVKRYLTLRNLLISFTSFILGAAPVLVYNARHDFATLSENTQLAPESLGDKWIQVPSGLAGRSLFGYIVREEEASQPKPAWVASQWIRERLGQRRSSIFGYTIATMLLAMPLWWRSRAAWFAILAFFGGWIAMALTANAGGAAHHVVLLWPLPALFASIALGRLGKWLGKWLAVAVAVAVVGMNLTVLHQYHYQFQRFGASAQWSDALFPLARELSQLPGKTIYITDWGIYDSLALAQQGRLNLRMIGGELAADNPSEAERANIAAMLADSQGILVSHAAGSEVFPNVGSHLRRFARESGREIQLIRPVHDSNGRPIFELSKIATAGQ